MSPSNFVAVAAVLMQQALIGRQNSLPDAASVARSAVAYAQALEMELLNKGLL
jgi:hypothetical protein